MIKKRLYKDIKDLNKIYSFLSNTYIVNQRVDNWDVARWLFNRFCIHSQEEIDGKLNWINSIQIWEDDSKIAAISHSEEMHDYFIQIDRNYEYLLEDILSATFEHSKSNLGLTQYINISSLDDDKYRLTLFNKYNGIKNDFIDDNRRLQISDFNKEPRTPNNYAIKNISLKDKMLCAEIAKLYQRIWPESSYISKAETVMNLKNAIGFTEQLSFVLYNPNGEYAGFYILWSDEAKKNAHLYPFGIDRTITNNDAVEAFLIHGINELKSLGYESLTLGAWYSEEDEMLFENLGFIKTSPYISYRFSL